MRVQFVVLLAGAVALSSSLAQAQAPGGRGAGRFGGGFPATNSMLLGMPEVQKEISVTDEQKTKIQGMLDQARGNREGGGFGDFQNLSQEERQKRFEEIRKQMEERNQKFDESLKTVLNEQQMARLGELRLQRDGLSALERKEVADKLSLSEEQREKIRKAREAARGGDRGGFNPDASREEREKAAAEARARREKADAEVLAVLTDEQKAKWEKMTGKKFDFPRFGGFGGGRPRTNNNN